MNEILETVLLGIIQGLTEFLPVSSSGHLEIAKVILGEKYTPAQSLMVTVVLHAATAIATVLVFRKEIGQLITRGLTLKDRDSGRYIFYILLSMVPAALIGYFNEPMIESLFMRNIVLVGCALIATAALLLIADYVRVTNREVDLPASIVIGLAQAMAILPGISRSGATIATAVLLKVNREEAARFSFLMVIPLILGRIIKYFVDGELQAVTNYVPLIAGFVAALVTGILACIWMINLVKKAKLKYFSIYCLIVGTLCILWANGVF